jgi:carbonic anhydrase
VPDVVIDYAAVTPVRVVDTGHTMQFPLDAGGTATIEGVAYDLEQVHFHAPSERAIDGDRLPMEAHVVHRNAEGDLAVLGVLIREGAAHHAFETLFADLPPAGGEERTVDAGLDPPALLPEDRTIYRYAGSLTTPPCTEGVTWLVFAEPIEASGEQIAAFTVHYHDNARPLQPAGSREILLDPED